MKKLGALFYIILGLLTVAVLVTLSLWIRTMNPIYFYLLLASFVVYVFHLVFHFVRTGKEFKKDEVLRSSFLLLSQSIEVKVVYITYLGNKKHIEKPSKYRKDYLIEFYSADVDISTLKKHLWFELPAADENKLKLSLIGDMDIPYSFLDDISGKTVLVQAYFFETTQNSPLFKTFFEKNKIVLYGE